MNIIKQFNRNYLEKKQLIQKALDSSTGVAEALIPQHLEEIITNVIVRLSPELAMIMPKFDQQKLHEFNRLLSLPSAGGAMGESAVTPTRQSAYERASVSLKIIRRKGAVTNFLQDASGNYIDSAAAEMENHLLSHIYDMVYYILYGNADSNKYEFSGIDRFITTNRNTQPTETGTILADLSVLDGMIDENLERQGSQHSKAFLMSPQMLSRVSQLLTNVRLNQGLQGSISQVDINGGWRLNAYRDIPIITTSSMRPKQTMTAIGTATATTGGTLPDATTFFFRVAAMDYNGESLGSAEVSQLTGAGGGVGTITLSWTAVPGALSYKIYMGTGAGATFLVRQVSAFTYDGQGTITGATTSIVITSPARGPEINAEQALDRPFVGSLNAPPETLALWDLDEAQGLGRLPYTNTAGSKFGGLVTIKPLAEVDDDIPFLVKTYAALADSFEATSIWERGFRVA